MSYSYKIVDYIPDTSFLKYEGDFDVHGYKIPRFSSVARPRPAFYLYTFGLSVNDYSDLRSLDDVYSHKDRYFCFQYALRGKMYFDTMPYNLPDTLARNNLETYFCFPYRNYTTPLFSSSDRDEFLKKVCDYYMDGNDVRIDWFCVHSIEKVNPSGTFERDLYDLEICFDSAIILEDFSVDFSPLLKAFRIKSSSIQVHNIRDFCRLFSIPEIVAPLGEPIMKQSYQIKTYLKLLTSAFGGKGKVSDDDDLNINLKTLCKLVGVPTSDSGLKGDELSNMYIKRISAMLGVKHA